MPDDVEPAQAFESTEHLLRAIRANHLLVTVPDPVAVRYSATELLREKREKQKRLQKRQEKLATEIANMLYEELRPYVDNKKLSALEGYVSWPTQSDNLETDIDVHSLKTCLRTDLKRYSLEAMIGYSVWACQRIKETKDTTIPTPSEIDYENIQKEYDVPPELLRRTITYLNSKKQLPILGRIKDGKYHTEKSA